MKPAPTKREHLPTQVVEGITVEPPAEEERVSPMDWFASPGPLEIEIGCGKGGFLVHRAKAHPELRFLGIEWANKYYRFAADRMRRWGLTNVRVMRTDARAFVVQHLPAESVSVLHVYHPDPWPKKRHHKRRLISSAFADAVVRVLSSGGRWLLQSDHAEYFTIIREQLDAREDLREIDWADTGVDVGDDWEGTNFEVKYRREGRDIRRVAYQVRK